MSPTTTTHTTTETPRSPGDPGGSASHCRRISRRTARLAAVVLAAAIAGAACGSTETPIATPSTGTPVTAAPGASVASPAAVRPTGEVDRLVAIPGGRMHLRCTGHGDATVVLISGWDGGDGTWKASNRLPRRCVCAPLRVRHRYQRSGHRACTFTDASSDLRVLLDMAGEPGPYVLLGHSFGAVAVAFAATDPSGVKALLLLDASPTDWPSVCTVPTYREACDLMHDPPEMPSASTCSGVRRGGPHLFLRRCPADRDDRRSPRRHRLSPADVERLDAPGPPGRSAGQGSRQRHGSSPSSRPVTTSRSISPLAPSRNPRPSSAHGGPTQTARPVSSHSQNYHPNTEEHP